MYAPRCRRASPPPCPKRATTKSEDYSLLTLRYRSLIENLTRDDYRATKTVIQSELLIVKRSARKVRLWMPRGNRLLSYLRARKRAVT